MTATERGRILRRAEQILRARRDEIARIETMDTGRALSETVTLPHLRARGGGHIVNIGDVEHWKAYRDRLVGSQLLGQIDRLRQRAGNDDMPSGEHRASHRNQATGLASEARI